MDSRKPLTAGEIEELNVAATKFAGHGGKGIFVPDAMRVFELLPCLLSTLTPPPDAAVREAVERCEAHIRAHTGHVYSLGEAISILLRAVQAPRLTGEQVEQIRHAEKFLRAKEQHIAAEAFRAAFPEAFAGEV